jgi:hypothetical protein
VSRFKVTCASLAAAFRSAMHVFVCSSRQLGIVFVC